ncbi:MAG: ribosome silencing factor [Steroidobacteraceae bacterium]|nr:ribosome silencing factor [Steroidobacteraceae bacterium]
MTAKRPATRRTTRSATPKPKSGTAAKSRTGAVAKKTKQPARAKSVSARKVARPKAKPELRDVVLGALAELKAVNVRALDVRGITDITDTMVVASGTSDRHVKSIADRVVQRCKEAGYRPYGMEGERDGEWVLLDLQDVVLHVMLPRAREFYALEKLWEGGAAA